MYDVGAFGNELFVAMEYVDGETLRHWRDAQPRSPAEILTVYERAGRGLAAARTKRRSCIATSSPTTY